MVSVGQPLDVAVTLPQRAEGGYRSHAARSARFCAPLPLGLINLITAFALAILPLLT